MVTFVASSLGLISLMGISYWIQETSAGRLLTLAGQYSLYIYVMHKFVIFFSKYVFGSIGLHPLLQYLSVFILAFSIPLLVQRYLVKGYFIYLFKQPFFRSDNRSKLALTDTTSNRQPSDASAAV